MISKFQTEDLDKLIEIWYNSNLEAHNFINPKFWKDNLDFMRENIPQAEVYVYKIQDQIAGFIGLQDNYMAGLFVDQNYRSHGIGKELTDYAKSLKESLTLNVFVKNQRAIDFYIREDFKPVKRAINEDTNEEEFTLAWDKSIENHLGPDFYIV